MRVPEGVKDIVHTAQLLQSGRNPVAAWRAAKQKSNAGAIVC